MRPQYCTATPTECRPLLSNVVSSMIRCSIGARARSAGITSARTRSRTAASLQRASETKCWVDCGRRERQVVFCVVAARAGARAEPLGDRLHALAPARQQQPADIVLQTAPPRIVADDRSQLADILLEPPLHRGGCFHCGLHTQ